MFQATPDEVRGAFAQVKNLNATIKKILRQEVKRGTAEERFFKDFRSIAVSPRADDLLVNFISKNYPQHERLFMVVAGYAHDDEMMEISGEIIDNYADAFNATYEVKDGAVSVKDPEKFESIAREAIRMIEKGLTDRGLPPTPFMKDVMMSRLFTAEVIDRLKPILG